MTFYTIYIVNNNKDLFIYLFLLDMFCSSHFPTKLQITFLFSHVLHVLRRLILQFELLPHLHCTPRFRFDTGVIRLVSLFYLLFAHEFTFFCRSLIRFFRFVIFTERVLLATARHSLCFLVQHASVLDGKCYNWPLEQTQNIKLLETEQSYISAKT